MTHPTDHSKRIIRISKRSEKVMSNLYNTLIDLHSMGRHDSVVHPGGKQVQEDVEIRPKTALRRVLPCLGSTSFDS